MSDHTEEQESKFNDSAADAVAAVALIAITITIVVFWLSGKAS